MDAARRFDPVVVVDAVPLAGSLPQEDILFTLLLVNFLGVRGEIMRKNIAVLNPVYEVACPRGSRGSFFLFHPAG
jgi:hypothetical protein